jgi:hypothetical protein
VWHVDDEAPVNLAQELSMRALELILQVYRRIQIMKGIGILMDPIRQVMIMRGFPRMIRILQTTPENPLI